MPFLYCFFVLRNIYIGRIIKYLNQVGHRYLNVTMTKTTEESGKIIAYSGMQYIFLWNVIKILT